MENSKYKPILVLYTPVDYIVSIEEVKKIKQNFNYDVLLFQVSDEFYARAEIISVDKATVVEDIQKYIDLKFEEKDNEPNIPVRDDNIYSLKEEFFPDVDTSTYLGENKIPNTSKEQRANITRN